MRADRHQQKKTKRKKRWILFFLIIFILIVAAISYIYIQYRQGVNQSLGKVGKDKQQVEYQFNGEKDQYGGTNILILGSDQRGDEKARSDTMMIAQYHPEKGTYKVISIMRDIYANIPGHDKQKINAAFAFGGPELVRQTIKENFDIDLQYYMIVDFEGFVQIIDEAFPNGVEIDVEKEMSEYIDVELKPGLQRLNGQHLLGYVRFRHDAIGDFGRVQRQQKALQALTSQFANVQTIAKLPKLAGVLTPFVQTNMDVGDMLFIGKDVIGGKQNIETMRIPVDGTYENLSVSGIGDVLDIDLDENKAAIHDFLSK
ncbi:LCP family protein [Bacillaceae bacterium Marseille-Q3522]|nr:LCP family protein [Bacillaceae bacterium Marseille-Q3522]